MTERVVQIRVSVLDDEANAKLDALKKKLQALTKDVWKIRIKLDDGGAGAIIDRLQRKLDKLSKDYTPKVKADGFKRLDAEADKLNAKLNRATRNRTIRIDVDQTGTAGAGAGGGGGDNTDSRNGFFSRAGAILGPAGAGLGIGAVIAAGSSLAPALVPLLIGLATGGLVGRLAIGQGTTGLAAIQADKTALATARTALIGRGNNTPQNRLALQQALAQLQSDQARYGPFLGLGQQAGVLGPNALSVFVNALTAHQGTPGVHFYTGLTSLLGGHGLGGPSSILGGQVPGLPGKLQGPQGMGPTYQPSFVAGLETILAQINGFIKSIGPGLGAMFRASLPIIMMFVKSLEYLAKTLLPVFAQSMRGLAPVLPIIQQGLKFLAQGVAGFVKGLGPGTKDSAIIFKTAMLVIRAAMTATGYLASALAITFVKIGEAAGWVSKNSRKYWDELRHNTAVIFDGMRHEIAHIWDSIFNDTIGAFIRFSSAVNVKQQEWEHGSLHILDDLRHGMAAAWDLIWNNTVVRVERGYHDVLAWFNKLQPSIQQALKGLGQMFLGIATGSIGEFLKGLESGGSAILGWIKSFFASIPSTIMHLLGMSPPHPGSAFYDLGANFMAHVEAGMKAKAASVAAAAHGVAGGSAAAYAHALANKIGWGGQWAFINDVAMRESGWNMHARNPSSGAYGIAQFINGPSEYYQYGGNPNTVSGQVIAFFNYIRKRYGNPAAAWAHELRFGWYDKGGKLPPGLSLALNTTGHDEIHATGASGDTYHIYLLDDANPDASALRVVKKIKRYKVRHGNQVLGIA